MELGRDFSQEQGGGTQRPSNLNMEKPDTATSSLSELSSSPPIVHSGNRYDMPYDVAQVGSDEAGPYNDSDDDSDDDESDESDEECPGATQRCPSCRNIYASRMYLNRHLSDKRSVCGKNLYEFQTRQRVWACPRCDVQMSKKYSTDRHIRDSCWKVCDECCESRKSACDAIHMDGPCTHCVNEGKACTKRTETPADCNTVMVMIPVAQDYNTAPKSTRKGAIPGTRRLVCKRKAGAPPDTNSEVTHEAKRSTFMVKEEMTTPTHLNFPSIPKIPSNASQLTEEQTDMLQEGQVQQPNRIGPAGSHNRFPTALVREMKTMRRRVPQTQRLPVGPGDSQQQMQGQGSTTPFAYQYPLRQEETSQPYGGVPNVPHPNLPAAIFAEIRNGGTSSMQTWDNDKIRMNLKATVQELQHRIHHMKALEAHNPTGVSAAPVVPTYIGDVQQVMGDFPPPNARHPNSNHMHGPMSSMERFRRAQTHDINGSHVAANVHSHGMRPSNFPISAPGSRMPSRQSSPKPLRSRRMSTRRLPSLQLEGLDNLRNNVTKASIVRNSTKPLALQRSKSPITDENAPIMRFKIHSNTYDINNTPIFSILTLCALQKFGPRLDAYCQHRKKQYGVDWNFVYQYKPGDGGTQGMRYIKIEYDMTPRDVYDEEFPDSRLQDMDTIMVVKVQPRALVGIQNDGTKTDIPLSPIGSQVSEEVVDITDGDTEIYQNAGTITQWHRDVESKMISLRTQVNALNTEMSRKNMTVAQQRQVIADLQAHNAELMRNNNMLAHFPNGRPPIAQVWGQPVPSQSYSSGLNSLSAPAHKLSFAPHQINPRTMPSQGYMQPNLFYPTFSNTNTEATGAAHARNRRPTHNSGSPEPFPDFAVKEDKVTEDALRLLTGKTPGPELQDLSMGEILRVYGKGPLSARARTFAESLEMREKGRIGGEVDVEEREGEEFGSEEE